jgi:predicted DNA-binding protein
MSTRPSNKNMKCNTRPVPIRLDKDLSDRLTKAAKKMGSTASGVIRFAVVNQLPEIEAGRITLHADTKTA